MRVWPSVRDRTHADIAPASFSIGPNSATLLPGAEPDGRLGDVGLRRHRGGGGLLAVPRSAIMGRWVRRLFVVSGNADGSLKLTESRVLEATGFAATIIRVSLSWTVGFMGLISTLKGAKATAHASHKRGSHVGSDEQRVHEILAHADPDAAILLVRCKDGETWQVVAAGAADHASYSVPVRCQTSSPASTEAVRRTGCAPPSTADEREDIDPRSEAARQSAWRRPESRRPPPRENEERDHASAEGCTQRCR